MKNVMAIAFKFPSLIHLKITLTHLYAALLSEVVVSK